MKKILLKTMCLTTAIPLFPLVSCAKNENTVQAKDVHNEITSDFFTQLKNICFEKQIKNEPLWAKFVEVFDKHEDTDERVGTGPNWRCEFWGKMMRGAVMCYKYSHDEDLYNKLVTTVNGLLATQDDWGRISTYAKEKEYGPWDMWGRKYVITGLLHFYEICKSEQLKQQIIEALKKHADYILDTIGDKPGQRDITTTGYEQWKGINSCTILEPMVNLYEVTKEKRYLDFATYIINTGGVSKGNMIQEALAKTAPWLMPVKKSYESMSFFEGVYRYGKVVHDQNLIQAALNYFTMVAEQEITVIGSGGWEEEQWHHGIEFQTISHTGLGHPYRWGQETCVTVTWMRILNILYEETHDIAYYEMFANSAMNAFLGALNIYDQKIAGVEDIFPFDTYSPLYNEPRGINGGGVVKFLEWNDEIKSYGCCQCNAPVVVGLMGINYCRALGDALYLNECYEGSIKNDETEINIAGDYLTKGEAYIEVNSTSETKLMLRVPSWTHDPVIKVNGQVKTAKSGTYCDLGKLNEIDGIEINFNPKVELKKMNDKMYFTYGPFVLAFDENLNPWTKGQLGSFNMQVRNVQLEQILQKPAAPGELVHFEVPFRWGEGAQTLVLTNYSSAGRHVYYDPDDEDQPYMVSVFLRNDY